MTAPFKIPKDKVPVFTVVTTTRTLFEVDEGGGLKRVLREDTISEREWPSTYAELKLLDPGDYPEFFEDG